MLASVLPTKAAREIIALLEDISFAVPVTPASFLRILDGRSKEFAQLVSDSSQRIFVQVSVSAMMPGTGWRSHENLNILKMAPNRASP
eukprot:s326_g31.t1